MANPDKQDHSIVQYDHTVQALEIERRRIADKLHDTVMGQINLILSQIQAYEQSIADKPNTRMALSVLATLIRDLLQQVHDLEADLRPTTLETLGLQAALESYANQQRRATGIALTLSLQRLRERLPTTMELTLFRVTQDVVERAVKHSQATQIVIQLQYEEFSLSYQIEDNGMLPNGAVLNTTKQRVRAMGGTMQQSQSRYGGLALTIEFDVTPSIDLTEREHDVIELIAEGLTNKEIAVLLSVSPRTVKFHLDNIFSKLNVNTRTEAAIYALRQGWVRKHPPA